jgi:mono/diheme cytochrome c family protein
MAAGAALLIVASAAGAAEREDPGKAAYLKYCGACHGPAGKGDGIAGTFMQPKPTDLTQIAKSNGGAFPYQRTMDTIDGRNAVRAHGDPDMPVWGQVLSEHAGMGHEARGAVKGTISLITNYIGSIQDK